MESDTSFNTPELAPKSGGGTSRTQCTLIIDKRERNVLRHDAEFATINYIQRQITTGDYVITRGDQIIAVIERKSLDDFAASLKDGRHDNREKMLDMRRRTGCAALYLVEGPEFPDPNSLWGNVPYRYIESAIFHIAVRDGITILRSRDTLHTAQLLARLVHSMTNLVRQGGMDGVGCDGDTLSMQTAPSDVQSVSTNASDPLAILTESKAKDDLAIVRECWCTFRGIALTTADDYIRLWSLADLVSGKVGTADITTAKLACGRSVGQRVVKSLTSIDAAAQAKLLATLPGISLATAKYIIRETPLGRLLSYPTDVIAMKQTGASGRKLGPKLAERIVRIFTYKKRER